VDGFDAGKGVIGGDRVDDEESFAVSAGVHRSGTRFNHLIFDVNKHAWLTLSTDPVTPCILL
jgi:hypothetical protein